MWCVEILRIRLGASVDMIFATPYSPSYPWTEVHSAAASGNRSQSYGSSSFSLLMSLLMHSKVLKPSSRPRILKTVGCLQAIEKS